MPVAARPAAFREADRKTVNSLVMWGNGQKAESKLAGDFTQWHTYKVEWRAGTIRMSVDDQVLYDSSMTPWPSTTVPSTTIKDPVTAARANVSNGALHVTDGQGPMTVDGTVNVGGTVNVSGSVTTTDPVAPGDYVTFSSEFDEQDSGDVYTVPAGKTLVLTSIHVEPTLVPPDAPIPPPRFVFVFAGGTEIVRVSPPTTEATVLPFLMSGGTDAKAWSRLGIRCFGFTPLRLPADLDFTALFHGVDERVPVDALEFSARVFDGFLDRA